MAVSPSYALKDKSNVRKLWSPQKQQSFQSYPQSLSGFKLPKGFQELIGAIFEARIQNNEPQLQVFRKKLIRESVINFCIFDVQATILPKSDSTPSLIQISVLKPLTGAQFSSYITPPKPIAYETALQTRIYNSRSVLFDLPVIPEICDQHALDYLQQTRYLNNTLINRAEVQQEFEGLQASPNNKNIEPLELLQLAIDNALAKISERLTFLDEDNQRAPYMHELLPALLQFIFEDAGDSSLTILLSHNGACWGEPLLKAELERACSSSTLDRILFIDSKEWFRHLFRNVRVEIPNEQGEDPPWSRLLGEKRPVSYNSSFDVISLWRTIEDVFERTYGCSDFGFIMSKFSEDIYLQKLQHKNSR